MAGMVEYTSDFLLLVLFSLHLSTANAVAHPRRYLEAQLPSEKYHNVIPEVAKFSDPAEVLHFCQTTGFGLASGEGVSFEGFRLTTVDFYQSGMPMLSSYHWIEAILQRKKQIAAVCPQAVLQAMLLLLDAVYTCFPFFDALCFENTHQIEVPWMIKSNSFSVPLAA